MLGDAFRVLINPKLKLAGMISVKGGSDYKSVFNMSTQKSR